MENKTRFAPSAVNFNERPFIVIWEVTQACDLACQHCRASSQPLRSPRELTTGEGKGLIGEIAAMQVPVFVITGGDPLRRPDIFHLVEFATGIGVRTSLSPSATPLLTREALVELKRCGLARLAVSLDGSSAAIHDSFRGVAGSYDRTLRAIGWARELDLSVQINTTVTRCNLSDIEAIAELLTTLDITLWSVFFLVPTGRGRASDSVTAQEFEDVFARLYQVSKRVSFDLKTTEAMHYRRYVLQKRAEEQRQSVNALSPAEALLPPARDVPKLTARRNGDSIGRAPRGLNDAKGFVFVSHVGEVFPSGFLPISAGNIRESSLSEIYRTAPLFVGLRDPVNLKGKCRVCEFNGICGGSRARAYALTGDVFGEEPCCVFQPAATRTTGPNRVLAKTE